MIRKTKYTKIDGGAKRGFILMRKVDGLERGPVRSLFSRVLLGLKGTVQMHTMD